jgi:hypothetical protein
MDGIPCSVAGRGPVDDDGLPAENLAGCQELLDEFEQRHCEEAEFEEAWPRHSTS